MYLYEEHVEGSDGEVIKFNFLDNPLSETNRSLDGDLVYVREGRVIGIKERKRHLLTGVILLNEKMKYGLYKGKILYLVKSTNPRYPDFYLPSNYKNQLKAKYVYFEFLEWRRSDKYPIGQVIEYLGDVGDQEAEYQHLRYRNELQWMKKMRFPVEKVEADRQRVASLSTPEYEIFTIDPLGCRDVDDGFHLRKLDGSASYEVGVHISYIWKFFERDAEYFRTFAQRVSTQYLHGGNIGMIGKEYSEDIGSFIERTKRFSLSILYQIVDGEIRGYEIKETTVFVNKNYDYDVVDGILGRVAKSKREEMLHLFHQLSQAIFQERIDSHRMVELWMIRANQTIANYMVERFGERAILRVQPTALSAEEVRGESELNKFLRVYRGEKAEYQIYDPRRESSNYHFSIDGEREVRSYYTHYTSPIRRFCDLYIHSLITETQPHIEITELQSMISHMNEVQGKLRKYQNQAKIIDFIFQHLSDPIIRTEAYLIDFQADSLKISFYLPQFGFVLKKSLRNYQYLQESLSILPSFSITSDGTLLVNERPLYQIYQKYLIDIYLFPQKFRLDERLQFEIIH